jgi:hypothetical protein
MGPRGGSAAIERPRGSPRHPHWSRRSGGARIAGDRSRTPRRRHRGRDRGGGTSATSSSSATATEASPVTGAADRIPERIATAVYVDSGRPSTGARTSRCCRRPSGKRRSGTSPEEGDGWRLPMPTWEELETVNGAGLQGLTDQTRHMTRERATPQPFGTYTQPIALQNAARTSLPHVLVSCSFPLEQVKAFIESGHRGSLSWAVPSGRSSSFRRATGR